MADSPDSPKLTASRRQGTHVQDGSAVCDMKENAVISCFEEAKGKCVCVFHTFLLFHSSNWQVLHPLNPQSNWIIGEGVYRKKEN